MRIKIPLSNGGFTFVSPEDVPTIWGYTWFLSGHGRVRAYDGVSKKHLEISRHIMKPPIDKVVDHIDRDPLNNTRDNLRICSQAENTYNKKGVIGASGFIGVHLMKATTKRGCPFVAAIKVNGKRQYIGVYRTAEEAARARDEKAKELHGEFAILNFKEVV